MIDDAQLALHWLDAASRPDVRRELEAVFADAARAIVERGPACWASGRCCNFEKTGHLLYVTGLEAAYTVRALRESPTRAPKQGSPIASLHVLGNQSAPPHAGACPFQIGNLCGVHEIKPLGCRVYFCDKSAQQWQNDLSERLLAEVRAIHARHALEYRYGEWRAMLGMFTE